MQNFIKLSAAVHELSTVHQILDNSIDFDCKYLWNGSSNRQFENGVIIYDFFTFGENNFVNFGSLTKNDLVFWHMTLKFYRVLEVVEVHVRAKYHQHKCSGS